MIHLQEGGASPLMRTSLLKRTKTEYNHNDTQMDMEDFSPMKINFAQNAQGQRLRFMSAETFNPVLHKCLSDYMHQPTPENKSSAPRQLADLLEKLVHSCTASVAEKILAILEDQKGSPTLDEHTAATLKKLLSSDEVIGKEVKEVQASYCLSITMLIIGLISLTACLYFTPLMFELALLNPMEVVEISSLVAWLTTLVILLSYTWECTKKRVQSQENSQPIDTTTEDVRLKLQEQLQLLDYEGLIKDIKFENRDDVMVYIGVKPEYRYPLFVAIILMTAGLIIMAFSLEKASQMICVLSVGLLTPMALSIAHKQQVIGSWAERQIQAQEGIDWVIEMLSFVAIITLLMLLDYQIIEQSSSDGTVVESGRISAVVPILGSICIGSSLGMYKKLALAERRASPGFPTAFVFYMTFALVMISPMLKYPCLASQINDLAGSTSETKRNQDSSYYSQRGIPIAFFFVLGFLACVTAFSLCNAMQHPQIRQSHVNILLAVVPMGICSAIETQTIAASLDVKSAIFISVSMGLILLTNILKSVDKAPLIYGQKSA